MPLFAALVSLALLPGYWACEAGGSGPMGAPEAKDPGPTGPVGADGNAASVAGSSTLGSSTAGGNVAGTTAGGTAGTTTAGTSPVPDGVWTGTWAASPQSGGPGFNKQTLRQIVYTSVGGDMARVRLSNVFGAAPVQISNVRIAQAASGSGIVPASSQNILFDGSASVTLAAGGSAVSDPVAFAVKALSNVTVSFYLPQAVSNSTCHTLASQTNYVAAGDVTASASLVGAQSFDNYCFLSNLDVFSSTVVGAVVALGASVTDGTASAAGANQRWPNDLARRLVAAGGTISVLNQGISGNRLLQDGAGESALHRFSRDALMQPNVKWIIFTDDPINDVGNTPSVSASALTAGFTTLITQAHAAGLKFYCATLLPFQGAGYWTAQGEATRQAVNVFIRSANNGCDGIIDVDTTVHDPARPTWLLPAYDSGDHLHPNDAGRQAIANAIDLTLFR